MTAFVWGIQLGAVLGIAFMMFIGSVRAKSFACDLQYAATSGNKVQLLDGNYYFLISEEDYKKLKSKKASSNTNAKPNPPEPPPKRVQSWY